MKKINNTSIRSFMNEDYHIVEEWAEATGQTPPPLVILPAGVVIEDEDSKPLGVGFVYTDDTTPVAVIEWVFVNPKSSPKIKHATMGALYDALEWLAIDRGRPFIMSSSNFKGVERFLNRNGYTTTGEGFSHLVKAMP